MTAGKDPRRATSPVKKQFESLVRAATDAILGVDHQGRITIWNAAATKMFGYNAKYAIGRSLHDLLVPERLLSKADRGFKSFVVTGKGPLVGKTTECIAKHKDGSEFSVELSISGFKQDGYWHATGIIRDITERKRMAQALQTREKQLSITLRSIGDAVISTDVQGRVELMNPVAEGLTGWVSNEATGKPLEEIFHIINEETRNPVENPASRVLCEGVVIGLANHTLLIARDGREVPIADCGAPIHDDQGQISGVVLVFRDQTAERKAQTAVQEARLYAESIIATVREPLLVLDAEQHVISANREFYRTFHVTEKETEGQLLYDLSNREWDIPALRKLLEEILPQNTSFDDYEVEHNFPHIGRRTMLLNARRIYREANKTQFILLAIGDITKRKQAEEKVRQGEKRVRLLLDSTAEGIYGLDMEGNCTFANASCCRLLGYDDHSELLGENMHGLIHHTRPDGSHYPARECRIIKAFRQGARMRVDDEVLWRKDGTSFSVSYSAFPVFEAGKVFGAVVTFLDISERVKAQKALEKSHEQLKASLIGTVIAVSRAVGARDPYTAGHQQRVSQLSRAIAQGMGLDSERIDGLRLGASIHDIGKIYLPAEILSKPVKLTDLEYELIKSHAQVGYDILKDIEFPWPVAEIAWQHHERLDGSGYPQGLRGDEICLEARIVAVADVVEAISSHRPYRPALGIDAALEEITKYQGVLYDAVVVDTCLKLFREKSFDFEK